MGTLGEAFEMALAAHDGQVDKAGMAYIAHVVRVAAGVTGDQARIVALLHDVVEDTPVTLDEVSERFGPRVAAAVDALTRRKDEAPQSYYARVRADALALTVKHSDLADNSHPQRLALLPEGDRARLMKKYAATRAALEE